MAAGEEGRYERVRLLGEGGSGRVWLVRDTSASSRLLALKELIGAGPAQESRLRSEFATLRTLHHPNLVEVHDFDVDPTTGLPQFTLEFVEGRDFVAAARGTMSPPLLELAAEALRALAFLHDFGLIHRDLKPENLLVREQPRNGARLVVLDFGLTLRDSHGTAIGAPAGTLPYLAPEILAGEAPGRRSDLWALGAVLTEVVYGRTPPNGVTHQGSGARAPETPLTVLPSGLSAWLEQMTAWSPEDRPSSAAEALASMNRACATNHQFETSATRMARLASGAPPGREREVRQVWEHLTGKSKRAIFLTGEAGSGKSRILRWIAAEAVRLGWRVETFSEGKAPGAICRDVPALLLVDDAESSGSEAAERIRASLVEDTVPKTIAAFRVSELRSGPLRQLLDNAAWMSTVARVDLPPLDLRAVERVLQRVTGHGEANGPQAEWLHDESEGVPLVLETLLVEQAWERRKATSRQPSLEESISRRLDRLSAHARAWIEGLCATLGTAGESLLAAVTKQAPSQLAESSAEALLAGLATRERDQWTPASSLVRRVALESLPLPTRQALHRLAAEALEQAGDPAVDQGRLARLWLAAGERESSITSGLRQAEREEQCQRPSQAADWFRFALTCLPRRDPRGLAIRRRQGAALMRAARHDEAVRAFSSVSRRVSESTDRVEVLADLAGCYARGGRLVQALTVADQAIALAETQGLKHAGARARVARGMAMINLNRQAEALPVFLESSREFAGIGDESARAKSLQLAGLCASGLRQLAEARELLEEAVRIARACEDWDVVVTALVTRGLLEQRAWNVGAATAFLEQARGIVDDRTLLARLPIVLSSLALALESSGRYAEALAAADEAISIAQRWGDRPRLFHSALTRANALILLGQPAKAAEELDRLVEEFKTGFEPKARAFASITIAEALAEMPKPDTDRMSNLLAEALLHAGQDPKVVIGVKLMELERSVLCGAIGFDDAWTEYERAVERNPVALEPPAEMRALLARAESLLSRERPGEAIEVATRAAELGEAKDLPSLAARAHAQIAVAKRLAGDSVVAARSHRRARELLDEAARRIADEEMRRGFLDRPVFRTIRRAGADGATSGEQRLLAIYDMIRALNSETDPEDLLSAMLDMALEVVRAERGLILLSAGESADFTVRLARNLEKETIEDATEFSRNVVLSAGTGKAVLAIDTGADERLRDLKSVTTFGIRSVLCVPLRSRGRIVGTVYLDNRQEGSLFTPDDLRFLEAFADHAALALENARIRRDLELENRRLRVAANERVRFDNIVGRSEPMQQVFELIVKMAASHLPVLILGESGTGKELVARSIHAHSPRRDKPFLSENCAAIPESLLESELFGHVKGAFTGAERDRMGLFEQAHGGTLFLDEIGDMPKAMQARLLRVLQDGELRRVGGEGTLRVDVRLLAATHRDLEAEVREGRLREDLYYRLQVLVIRLPPLRLRFGDVPLLLEHFLERISRERGRKVPRLHGEVLELFERYAWPGNVRQLENHIQRLALLAGDGPITLDVVRSDRDLRDTLLSRRADPAGPVQPLEKEEQQLIREALAATKGNRARAARMLGISRSTIFRKLKEYGLDQT